MADKYIPIISECHRLVGNDSEVLSNWGIAETDEIASTLILLLESPKVKDSTKTAIVALITDMIRGGCPSEMLYDRFVIYLAKEINNYMSSDKLPPINYIYAFDAISHKEITLNVLSTLVEAGVVDITSLVSLVSDILDQNGDIDEIKLNKLYEEGQQQAI